MCQRWMTSLLLEIALNKMAGGRTKESMKILVARLFNLSEPCLLGKKKSDNLIPLTIALRNENTYLIYECMDIFSAVVQSYSGKPLNIQSKYLKNVQRQKETKVSIPRKLPFTTFAV